MRTVTAAAVLALATLVHTPAAFAQELRGFVGRASVEDYLAKVGTQTDYYTDHQITIRVAVTFR